MSNENPPSLNWLDNPKVSNQFELISLNEDSEEDIDLDNYMDNFRLKMDRSLDQR